MSIVTFRLAREAAEQSAVEFVVPESATPEVTKVEEPAEKLSVAEKAAVKSVAADSTQKTAVSAPAATVKPKPTASSGK
jgi:hypothetical protein